MVAQYDIVRSLKRLEVNFNAANSPIDQRYLSKVALIELCGWIEEEIDKLMLKYAQRCLRQSRLHAEYKQVVDGVYGFDYEKHFKKMLIQLVGMHGTHWIEGNVGDNTREQFKSVLGGLKRRRDMLAHNQLKGQTTHLLGFSVLLNNQNIVYTALYEYELALVEYLP